MSEQPLIRGQPTIDEKGLRRTRLRQNPSGLQHVADLLGFFPARTADFGLNRDHRVAHISLANV
jgi:hypothetical protein